MEEYIAEYVLDRTIGVISESSSVLAHAEDILFISAYEKIIGIDTRTMFLSHEVNIPVNSSISSICAVKVHRDTLLCVGHDNGVVCIVGLDGEELSGYREHMKRVSKIVSNSSYIATLSSDRVVLYGIETESVLCAVECELSIVSIFFTEEKELLLCSEKGIVHRHKIDDLINHTVDSQLVSLGDKVLSVSQDKYILPECILPQRVSLGHRAVCASQENNLLLSRDTKGKVHLLRIIEEKNFLENIPNPETKDKKKLILENIFSIKTQRPFKDLLLLNNRAVILHADNGISLYSLNNEYLSLNALRDSIISIGVSGDILLGVTETEGRIFGRFLDDEFVSHGTPSLLFEDEGILCMAQYKEEFFLGKRNGTISVRNRAGEEKRQISLSNTPIVSLSISQNIIAAATEQLVILLVGEEKEEISYADDVLLVKLSDNGTLIFSSLADNTVRVSKIDGTPLLTLYGHSVPVVDIVISQEKERIYTLGGDKLIKVWGLRHGECRKTLNPDTPTGLLLKDNLLLVSTAEGLVYYLSDTLEQVKRVKYTKKTKTQPGTNKLLQKNNLLFSVRDRSISLFLEQEEGTSPQRQREEHEEIEETERISKEKRIFKIDHALALDQAIEENDKEKVYSSLTALPVTDIQRTIDAMSTRTRTSFSKILLEIRNSNYNPLIIGWTLSHLIRQERLNELLPFLHEVQIKLRKHSRNSSSLQAAIAWSIE
ncbi:hypothetical protein NEFER03_2071 [Nematocida sp. LUAm3]|nr:hypothetical protein NEFER03_2071 [Nematocida sp. LUAm3]KAI5176211.1 hypothetical protein NEFER02_2017 [Nematocida sp. LUAm2]KAI5179199.1 hypothetical protein NEFER01_2056 [Nematocida sp. LUAm1]